MWYLWKHEKKQEVHLELIKFYQLGTVYHLDLIITLPTCRVGTELLERKSVPRVLISCPANCSRPMTFTFYQSRFFEVRKLRSSTSIFTNQWAHDFPQRSSASSEMFALHEYSSSLPWVCVVVFRSTRTYPALCTGWYYITDINGHKCTPTASNSEYKAGPYTDQQ